MIEPILLYLSTVRYVGKRFRHSCFERATPTVLNPKPPNRNLKRIASKQQIYRLPVSGAPGSPGLPGSLLSHRGLRTIRVTLVWAPHDGATLLLSLVSNKLGLVELQLKLVKK